MTQALCLYSRGTHIRLVSGTMADSSDAQSDLAGAYQALQQQGLHNHS